ncbi:hypothetical protein [Sinorhizobium fredii]|uniref:hypothetical protein n=1 Tax=Rhizobium fredii TaxID=380 RepID=UPI000D59CAE0|nr:hypothetical protein [Sinorhizobium fredii]
MGATTSGKIEISPSYTVQDWLNLGLDSNPTEANWVMAVDILKDRIEGRFLKPAKALIDVGETDTTTKFGFAILALDFLVIETIQGFREGVVKHKNGKSSELFKNFLTTWTDFQACVPNAAEWDAKAGELYSQGRCALHHSGTTDKILVKRSRDMLVFQPDGTIQVNRTEFHERLTDEFNRYIAELKIPASVDLRAHMKTKMDAICQN